MAKRDYATSELCKSANGRNFCEETYPNRTYSMRVLNDQERDVSVEKSITMSLLHLQAGG